MTLYRQADTNNPVPRKVQQPCIRQSSRPRPLSLTTFVNVLLRGIGALPFTKLKLDPTPEPSNQAAIGPEAASFGRGRSPPLHPQIQALHLGLIQGFSRVWQAIAQRSFKITAAVYALVKKAE